MPTAPLTRRSVLATSAGWGAAILTGCLSWGYQAGSLHIDNDHNQGHTVTVTVQKTSDDYGEAIGRNARDPQTPSATPIWTRAWTFRVPPSSRVYEGILISEPGAFYIHVQLETGVTAALWLGLYPAGPDGDQIAEQYIAVDIYPDGRLSVSAPHDD